MRDPAGVNRQQLTDAEKSVYLIPVWQLSGRLSIRSEDEAMTGALRWQQQGDAFTINFNAPFGQGALQIKGDAIGVELLTAAGDSLQADDIDSLFEEAAGWELPLSGLRYWIFGVPSPHSKAILERAMTDGQDAQRIARIRQSDWDIEIARYAESGARVLPRKLRLSNDTLRVRMVVDRWQIDAATDVGGANKPAIPDDAMSSAGADTQAP